VCIHDVNDLIEGIFLTFGGSVLLIKGYLVLLFVVCDHFRHFFSFF